MVVTNAVLCEPHQQTGLIHGIKFDIDISNIMKFDGTWVTVLTLDIRTF